MISQSIIDVSRSVDYELYNGKWIVDNYDYEDDNEVYSIEDDKLKMVYTSATSSSSSNSEVTYTIGTQYVSIAEKTSTYWTMKFERLDTDGNNDVMYQKWYLSPTAEMLDPSKLEVGSYNAPSKSEARINKMKRPRCGLSVKILGMLIK